MDLMARRRLLMMDALKAYQVTGNPAVFSTNLAKPLKGLSIPFLPVQTGSGDPSPSNVRPITGWNGVTVYHSGADTSNPTSYPISFPAVGKNLFNVDSPYQQPDNTNWQNTSKRIFKANTYCIGASWSNYFIPAQVESYSVQNGEVYVKSSQGYGVGFPMWLESGQTYHISSTTSGTGTIQVAYYDSDGTWLTGSNSNANNGNITVPTGAVTTVLILYSDGGCTFSNIMLNKGSTAESYEPFTNTIYGGTLDAVNGVVEVSNGYIASYNGETLPGKWISDRDVYSAGTTPTTGAEVVYELATPYTIPLSALSIPTLIGDNVVWTDTNGSNIVTCLKRG